jgi:DNA helicase-2/ATP-dependent DNA helicase PcrA
MIRSFHSMMGNKNAYDIAFHVGKQTAFVKELFNDKSTEGVQRYENVQELLNSIKEFTETPLSEESGEVGDKSLVFLPAANHPAHRCRSERSGC